jgi:hypothetical protein
LQKIQWLGTLGVLPYREGKRKGQEKKYHMKSAAASRFLPRVPPYSERRKIMERETKREK